MGIIDDFLNRHRTTKTKIELLDPKKKLFLSDKPYSINKEAKEGEKELVGIARSERTEREGAWIYSKELNRWYNIVSKHFREEDSEGVTLGVVQYKFRWNQLGKNFTHYHIHPAIMEKHLIEARISSAEQAGVSGEELDIFSRGVPYIAAIITAIPSNGDVKGYLDEAIHNSDCKIEFKIISPHGTTTAQVNPTKYELNAILSNYERTFSDLTLEGSAIKFCEFGNIDASIVRVIEEINRRMGGALTLEYTAGQHSTSESSPTTTYSK